MSKEDDPERDEDVERLRRETIEPLDIGELRREPALEYIARAVTELCEVSMAHVSIMEDDRQCLVGEKGIDRDQFARDQSFCAYTLASREPLVVEDLTQDDRFVDNPFVREAPYIRFYAGFPLEVQGIPVGTICAMDDQPRELTQRCRGAIAELSRFVEEFLETKLVAPSASDPRHRLAGTLAAMSGLTAILDARSEGTPEIGEIVGELKECIEESYDAVDDWIGEQEEHKSG